MRALRPAHKLAQSPIVGGTIAALGVDPPPAISLEREAEEIGPEGEDGLGKFAVKGT
jgi:hypothetical protein